MPVQAEILKRAGAALEREPRVNLHRYPIRLGYSDGVVTLEGEVEDIAAKKLALKLAARVPGVAGVVDRLRLHRAVAAGDGLLRDHVGLALLQEPALEQCTLRTLLRDRIHTLREAPEDVGNIDVEVREGVVILNGKVPSLSHKRLAGVLVFWVPEARDVINGLEVVPDQEDTDEELTEAVRLVLEKDPLVNAHPIRVSTRNRTVTLEGPVPNEAIKRMVELDSWYVLGVDEVINHLEVRS
jgi:osmotically-inducible protein OsmY